MLVIVAQEHRDFNKRTQVYQIYLELIFILYFDMKVFL